MYPKDVVDLVLAAGEAVVEGKLVTKADVAPATKKIDKEKDGGENG